MRLNKYIASSTGLSRRAADEAIYRNRVQVNGEQPSAGQDVSETDIVTLDDKIIKVASDKVTIMLNKPVGYVCSREGQGSKTVYNLLPPELYALKPVGRLDKDSSGLVLLTTDGALAQELTHPKYQKTKVYEVTLDMPLVPLHRQLISDKGIDLEDGRSQFTLERIGDSQDDTAWQITMQEGRNRQIRRTFTALGYTVQTLHRTQLGVYNLGNLKPGQYIKTN